MAVLADVKVRVHVVPEAESQPLQPSNTESTAGVAVSVTTVPYAKSTEQLDPQSIWFALSGLEVEATVP